MLNAPTLEHIRSWLDYDPGTGVFTWKVCLSNAASAGSRAGSVTPQGYNSIQINKRSYRANRLAWFYVTGNWPSDEIDHENRVKTDDRFDNLRDASRSQNQANAARRKDNRSGYKGVRLHKGTGRWMARIQYQHRSIYLGLFNSPEAAAVAYITAASQYQGEFARAA